MARILVIEDQISILEEIRDMLEFDGHEVIIATNGLEGLEQAKAHLPDLIISDIMMPEMDGYQVYQALSHGIATSRIPFIFLTALASLESVRQGMNLGVDDYLSKPFVYETLTKAVKARLDKQTRLEKSRLEEFAQKLITSREQELAHLAQTLEENVSPLQGIQLLFSTLQSPDSSPIQSFVTRANATLQKTLQNLQNTIQNLSPVMIDHLGIVASLYWLIEKIFGNTGADIRYEFDDEVENLPVVVKNRLYRLLAELLEYVQVSTDLQSLVVFLQIENNDVHLKLTYRGNDIDNMASIEYIQLQQHRMELVYQYTTLLNGLFKVAMEEEQMTYHLVVPLDSETTQTKRKSPTTYHRVASTNKSDTVRVILAHDSPFVLEGLQGLLTKHTRFQIMEQVNNVQELLVTCNKVDLDLLIVGISLNDQSLIDIVPMIREIVPNLKIIVISPYEEEIYALELFKRGIHGYLLLRSEIYELINAVDTVLDNHRFISKSIYTELIDLYGRIGENSSATTAYQSLTNRERQIMLLTLDGLSTVEIADSLSISPRTAETHRYNLMKKLGVSSQYDLMRYAMRNKLYKFSS